MNILKKSRGKRAVIGSGLFLLMSLVFTWSLSADFKVKGANFNLDGNVKFRLTGDTGSISIVSGGINCSQARIFLSGNWGNQGSFIAGASTVTFENSAATSTLAGNTTFHNLVCETPGKSIMFTAGSTQTVNNALVLTGGAGNLISLKSSNTGSKWFINFPNRSQSVNYVSVRDSNAGGNTVTCTDSIDSGNNNANWVFGAGELTWTVENVSETTWLGKYSSIASDKDGKIYISYYNGNSSSIDLATYAGSWSLATVEDTGNSLGYDTSLVIDGNGRPNIAYLDYTYWGIKFAAFDGVYWVKEFVLDELANTLRQPSLAIGGDGVPRVSFYNEGNNFLIYADKTSGIWNYQTGATSLNTWSSIALDSSGGVYIAYYDSTPADLYLWHTDTKYGPSGAVGVDTNISFDFGKDNAIAIDGNDVVHIAYLDNTNYSLKYASGVPQGGWSKSIIDMSGTASAYGNTRNVSIALDGNGYPVIAYRTSATETKVARWTGTAWNISLVEDLASVRFGIDVCIDRTGYIHLSYDNDSAKKLRHAKSGSQISPSILPQYPTSVGYTAYNTSATLTWTDNAANETAYRVKSATLTVNPTVLALPVNASSATITGLTEGATYIFYIQAVNAGGHSNSAPVTFYTLFSGPPADSTVPGAITNLTAIPGTNEGEIILSWTATGDDDYTGAAALYELKYATSTFTSGQWDDTFVKDIATILGQNPPAPQTAGTTQTKTITGLAPGTTYYFGIIAKDETDNNWSSLVNNDSAYAKIAPAPAVDVSSPPAPVLSSTLSGLDLLLSWTVYTASDFQKYVVYRSTAANFIPVIELVDSMMNFHSDLLTQNVAYTFKVRTFDLSGNVSPYSNEISTGVFADPTPPSGNIAVTNVSDSTSTLTGFYYVRNTAVSVGFSVSNLSGNTNRLEYKVGTSSGANDTGGGTLTFTAGMPFNATISFNGAHGLTYYLQFRLLNASGLFGQWTAPEKMQIDNQKPGTPTSLILTPGINDFTAAWTYLGDDQLDLDLSGGGFVIDYKKTGAADWTSIEKSTSAARQARGFGKVFGLSENTSYEVRVRIKDKAGNISEPVTGVVMTNRIQIKDTLSGTAVTRVQDQQKISFTVKSNPEDTIVVKVKFKTKTGEVRQVKIGIRKPLSAIAAAPSNIVTGTGDLVYTADSYGDVNIAIQIAEDISRKYPEATEIYFEMTAYDSQGTEKWTTSSDPVKLVSKDIADGTAPKKLTVYNSVMESARGKNAVIRYEIPREDTVTVTIYDTRKSVIKKIVTRERLSPGVYTEYWDGKDDQNEPAAPGIYLVYIESGDFKEVKKVCIIK